MNGFYQHEPDKRNESYNIATTTWSHQRTRTACVSLGCLAHLAIFWVEHSHLSSVHCILEQWRDEVFWIVVDIQAFYLQLVRHFGDTQAENVHDLAIALVTDAMLVDELAGEGAEVAPLEGHRRRSRQN